MSQLSFLAPEAMPPGLSYFPDFLSLDEESYLLNQFRNLHLSPMQFRTYTAKRNVLSFTEPVPDFLLPLVKRAEEILKVGTGDVKQILITHYPEGAPIGWHRDAPVYGQLFGISLGGECTMKLREMSGSGKYSLNLERRSAYMMKGPVRWQWEHHIPPVKEERYSLTFRTLVENNYSRYSSSAS